MNKVYDIFKKNCRNSKIKTNSYKGIEFLKEFQKELQIYDVNRIYKVKALKGHYPRFIDIK